MWKGSKEKKRKGGRGRRPGRKEKIREGHFLKTSCERRVDPTCPGLPLKGLCLLLGFSIQGRQKGKGRGARASGERGRAGMPLRREVGVKMEVWAREMKPGLKGMLYPLHVSSFELGR